MDTVFASIITIGDELLIGQVVDTNSAWMAQELNKIGIPVKHRVAVGDVWDDIWYALGEESKHASIILITGGLGPTSDDITKPLLCDYFGGKLIVHEPTLEHIKDIFINRLKRPMTETNSKQAEVPDVCTVLRNDRGTAPGMLFEKNGKVFISLPGVPHEMKWIMENEVLPLLPVKFKTTNIEHRTLLTAGIGESFLADMIKDIEASLPPFIKLAYLPNYGMVRLRLTATGMDKEALLPTLAHHFNLLKERVKEYLVIDEDLPMEAAIGQLLLQHGKTIATAESCTGGYIAYLVTSIPGASAYFKGSIVSYDNSIKTNLLGVPENILQTAGAVSEETVTLMAEHIRATMQVDYAVAVSGIMGPGGGTAEKPVGMVWICVAAMGKTVAKRFDFKFDRDRNTQLTAINALNMLRIAICG
ncbi:competence/damage-inducible protein A [Parasediminibacterium sp. JCM 36343]|uniref:competence/damage-inducible protein A n=1 Tax=Parasediminibacterium sp. JCM 36343 TaxID=3374279 RepID=UPI00397AB766